jgi:hypothetical protein
MPFIKKRQIKQVLSGGLVPVGGEGYKERVKESDFGGTICTHVCKWKNKTCGNYSRNGGGRDEGDDTIFNYDIL